MYYEEKKCLAESTFLLHAVMSTGLRRDACVVFLPCFPKHKHTHDTNTHTHSNTLSHIFTLSDLRQFRPVLCKVW